MAPHVGFDPVAADCDAVVGWGRVVAEMQRHAGLVRIDARDVFAEGGARGGDELD